MLLIIVFIKNLMKKKKKKKNTNNSTPISDALFHQRLIYNSTLTQMFVCLHKHNYNINFNI